MSADGVEVVFFEDRRDLIHVGAQDLDFPITDLGNRFEGGVGILHDVAESVELESKGGRERHLELDGLGRFGGFFAGSPERAGEKASDQAAPREGVQ